MGKKKVVKKDNETMEEIEQRLFFGLKSLLKLGYAGVRNMYRVFY